MFSNFEEAAANERQDYDVVSEPQVNMHKYPEGPIRDSLSLDQVVKDYDRMHKKIDILTKFYHLSPSQFIYLRRGSKWQPMLIKIAFSLGLLATVEYIPAETDGQKHNKVWLETLLIFVCCY